MNERAMAVVNRHVPSRAAARIISLAALMSSDLAVFGIALSVAVAVRVSLLPALSRAFWRPPYPLAHYVTLWWIPIVYLASLSYAGLYTRRDPMWEEVRRCLIGASVAALLIFAVMSIAKTSDDVSRPVIVMVWAILLILLPVSRWIIKEALVALGPWRRRALLVGTGPLADTVARALRRHRTLGYELVDAIPDPGSIAERAAEAGAQEIILAAPELGRAELLTLVERLRGIAENVMVAPDLAEAPVLGVEVLGFLEDRALLLRIPNNLQKPWNLALKRAFDLCVGTMIGVLALPFLALAALAIRLDSPGPVLHIEPRLGRNRTPFACLKLRTMHLDGDDRLSAYLTVHPEAAEEWEQYRKLRSHDPRVTRLGAVLRRYGLDEIPQVLNVLRGDMSLVGPRPYLPRELAEVAEEGMLDVRPGMSGLWQVSGKNTLDFRERTRLDRWYVNNWSLWLDVIVLVKTLPIVVRGE
jgi:Undecaprenyl-phosphate galactose phosphotransferase WbaP